MSAPARLVRLLPVAFLALAGVVRAPAALAQSKTGTAMGQFLLIEPSARVAGMGNAGVALPVGLDAVYFNPASIAEVDTYSLIVSHSAWMAGINYDYVAAAIPAGKWGSAYVAVTALNSGDIDVRTVSQPLGTGEKYSVNDVAIGLGFGRQLTDRFSAGGQVTFVQETIWNTSASTYTLDLGTHYQVSDQGLRIGASLSHLGTQAGYRGRDLSITYDNVPGQNGDNGALPGQIFTGEFPVPILFRFGVGMPFQPSQQTRLNVELDAFHPSDNSESVSFGSEATFGNRLALRLGYQSLFLEDSEVGLTAGAGVMGKYQTTNYRLDYAWADQGRLRYSQRFSLGLTF